MLHRPGEPKTADTTDQKRQMSQRRALPSRVHVVAYDNILPSPSSAPSRPADPIIPSDSTHINRKTETYPAHTDTDRRPTRHTPGRHHTHQQTQTQTAAAPGSSSTPHTAQHSTQHTTTNNHTQLADWRLGVSVVAYEFVWVVWLLIGVCLVPELRPECGDVAQRHLGLGV